MTSLKEKTMEVLHQKRTIPAQVMSLCLVLLGCGLITLSSLIRIPFYPVSFTMHTFAIFMLALTQSPKQALGSVTLYLLCGSLGLPVFAGHANLLWILGKTGGYYLGFLIAAYLTATIAQKGHKLFAMLCGQAVIYTLGFIWLSFYFGPPVALTKGVLFFIPSDMLKIFAVLGIVTAFRKWKKPMTLS
jgi:biotin transport system substrate-specific component